MYLRRYLSIALLVTVLAACTTVSRLDLSGMSFSSEPLTGKVIWYDLITEDLDEAKQFYGGMFGWTFEGSDSASGQPYVVARSGNVFVAGLLMAPASPDGEDYSRWLPYLSVPDVDDAVDRAGAAGGEVVVSARNVDIGRVAAILDPEGAVIGLLDSNLGDPDDSTTAAAAGRPVWTELLSDDPSAAAIFYRALVGYEARVIDRRGGKYTLLEKGGVTRAGILERPGDKVSPTWLTYFGVDDVAAATTLATTLGGEILLPPSADLRGGTMAVITDPSGAILVLQDWTVLEGISL
jgi:predicted enzyme related to lactoylglutathione lyase